MWLVPHEPWETSETSNAAGNWRRQWTTADLFRCHPSWPINFTPWHQTERHREREIDRQTGRERETEGDRDREGERQSKMESLKPLTKMHFVIKMWTFFMHNKYLGFEQLCERGLFCIKNVFFPAYIWDLWTLTVIRKTKGGSDSSSVSVVAMCWLPFSTVCHHLMNRTPVWSERPTRQSAIKPWISSHSGLVLHAEFKVLTVSCSPSKILRHKPCSDLSAFK